MLSKCANPDCFEVFRYLHQGKIFHLSPTLYPQATTAAPNASRHERFWLCARCSKQMTLTWDGNQTKLVRLPVETGQIRPLPSIQAHKNEMMRRRRPRGRGGTADRNDE